MQFFDQQSCSRQCLTHKLDCYATVKAVPTLLSCALHSKRKECCATSSELALIQRLSELHSLQTLCWWLRKFIGRTYMQSIARIHNSKAIFHKMGHRLCLRVMFPFIPIHLGIGTLGCSRKKTYVRVARRITGGFDNSEVN